MSNGLQLLILLAWAYTGPATAYYWLDLKYGWTGGVLWLAGLVFFVRWRMPSDLED